MSGGCFYFTEALQNNFLLIINRNVEFEKMFQIWKYQGCRVRRMVMRISRFVTIIYKGAFSGKCIKYQGSTSFKRTSLRESEICYWKFGARTSNFIFNLFERSTFTWAEKEKHLKSKSFQISPLKLDRRVKSGWKLEKCLVLKRIWTLKLSQSSGFQLLFEQVSLRQSLELQK